MKKRWILLILIALACLLVMPFQQAIVLTETKTTSPRTYIVPVHENRDFALRYTHSIHLSDVTEHYTIEDGRFRMRYMTYFHTAIGMPSTAEEGQTLTFENGMYTLTFEASYMEHFTLYVGDLDLSLTLMYDGQQFALKESLIRGHAYDVSIKTISLYDIIKGVTLQ